VAKEREIKITSGPEKSDLVESISEAQGKLFQSDTGEDFVIVVVALTRDLESELRGNKPLANWFFAGYAISAEGWTPNTPARVTLHGGYNVETKCGWMKLPG